MTTYYVLTGTFYLNSKKPVTWRKFTSIVKARAYAIIVMEREKKTKWEVCRTKQSFDIVCEVQKKKNGYVAEEFKPGQGYSYYNLHKDGTVSKIESWEKPVWGINKKRTPKLRQYRIEPGDSSPQKIGPMTITADGLNDLRMKLKDMLWDTKDGTYVYVNRLNGYPVGIVERTRGMGVRWSGFDAKRKYGGKPWGPSDEIVANGRCPVYEKRYGERGI